VDKIEENKLRFYEDLIHDMKAPLSILILNLDSVQKSVKLTHKLKPKYDTMQRCTNQLYKLINDLSDYNKMHRGVFNKYSRNLDIVQCLSRIVELTQGLGASKNVEIMFSSEVADKILAVDREVLDRIMLNLISNAVKHSEPGSQIHIKFEDSVDRVTIRVRNEGSGISPEMVDNLYQRYQWKPSRENPRGSGLGLSIVHDLINELNGGIDVNNSENSVEFSLWLPVHILGDCESQDKPFEDFYSENMVQIELSDQYE